MGERGEVFSTKLVRNDRTYFFNVKENIYGDLFLNIVERNSRSQSTTSRCMEHASQARTLQEESISRRIRKIQKSDGVSSFWTLNVILSIGEGPYFNMASLCSSVG